VFAGALVLACALVRVPAGALAGAGAEPWRRLE
jgi:hypothetical protein